MPAPPEPSVVRLGRTGLEVSRLGLGLAALGRPGYVNLGHGTDLGEDRSVEVMRRRCHQVLDAAWEAGVRYVDAARSYGLAEEFLATWLEESTHPRTSLTVGSKWGYTYTAAWRVNAEHHEVKDHSPATFRRQLSESRALLGDRLSLYQIHSVTPDSPALDDLELLEELADLRDSGVAVGLSLSGPRQAEVLRRAVSIDVGGRPLFGSVQATWNLLDSSAGSALEEAHRAGMGVIVKEALANGRLSGRSARGVPVPPLDPLRRAAAELGTTIDALAISAALAQPWADVVLSGATTVAQLESNLCALAVYPDRALIDALSLALGEAPEEYWAVRGGLRWN